MLAPEEIPMSMQPRTEAEIAIGAISDAIKGRQTRPIYLRVGWSDGHLDVRQVEYLTAEEFAQLAKVEKRPSTPGSSATCSRSASCRAPARFSLI